MAPHKIFNYLNIVLQVFLRKIHESKVTTWKLTIKCSELEKFRQSKTFPKCSWSLMWENSRERKAGEEKWKSDKTRKTLLLMNIKHFGNYSWSALIFLLWRPRYLQSFRMLLYCAIFLHFYFSSFITFRFYVSIRLNKRCLNTQTAE